MPFQPGRTKFVVAIALLFADIGLYTLNAFQGLDYIRTHIPFVFRLIANPIFMMGIAIAGLITAVLGAAEMRKFGMNARSPSPDASVKSEGSTAGPNSPVIAVGSGTVSINYGPDNTERVRSATPTQVGLECGARRARIESHQVNDTVLVESVTGRMAALVTVRNQSAITAKDVTARITFASQTDTQIVLHGTWLDTDFSSVWIEPGFTQQLLITVFIPEEDQYYALDCQRHEVSDTPRQQLRKLNRQIHRVVVTLSVNGQDKIFCFVLSLMFAQFKFNAIDCGTILPASADKLDPILKYENMRAGDDWPSSEMGIPLIVGIRNVQKAVANIARGINARLEYMHISGQRYVIDSAIWFVKGAGTEGMLHSSVDLQADERQDFALLLSSAKGVWISKDLLTPLHKLDEGCWSVEVTISAVNADTFQEVITFRVSRQGGVENPTAR